MKVLKDILYKVPITAVIGNTNIDINAIQFDSRKTEEQTLFVAQKGLIFDGHQFIYKAIKLGAKAIVCEILPDEIIENITYVQVKDSDVSLAIIAANFYENPSNNLQLIGVTGTNGKTTIATLLYQLFKKAGYKVGLLSTVKIMIDEVEYSASHTTPNSLLINFYLNEMILNGVDYCFMEVSSHGIHQKRTEGLHFAGGVFTNLTHDHLDYHKTFSEYRDIKKSFFDKLPKEAFALVNIDDKNGAIMLQNTKAKKFTYALKTTADYKGKVLENQLTGLQIIINSVEIWSRLIGSFNAYNLLAVFGVSDLLGLDRLDSFRFLSELESVNGRFQHSISTSGIITIIDYAHTPDALKNVLETINDIRTKSEKVITVVGCGGDRDKAKRPKMGHIASQLSSLVIFTSDNPRSEDPQVIINDIEKGVEPQNIKKTIAILDREQAIKTASKMAENGDIILIAGKGHETYQEIKGVRTDFDDNKKVKQILKELEK